MFRSPRFKFESVLCALHICERSEQIFFLELVGDSNVSNNTWKLTLEGTENTLGANKTNGKTSLTYGYSAENLIISHSAATTLTDATRLSMLTNDYEAMRYIIN